MLRKHSVNVPKTLDEYLQFVAIETARTAWPGSMMRGESQVLKKGAKKAVEDFFSGPDFPMKELWDNSRGIARHYDQWHSDVCRRLESVVSRLMGEKRKHVNRSAAIAAKLLDTFMHQLMKRHEVRALWCHLHLPLDRRILNALKKPEITFPGKCEIASILKDKENSPYSLERSEYDRIQTAMKELLAHAGKQMSGSSLWRSRIELNCLWV
jgi:hypothetical protein